MGEGPNHLDERYRQWKRMDLCAIALETMPKQVDKNKVLNDLLKLHNDFEEDLNEEPATSPPKPTVKTIVQETEQSSCKTIMKNNQSVSTNIDMSPNKLSYNGIPENNSVEPQQGVGLKHFPPILPSNDEGHFFSFQM